MCSVQRGQTHIAQWGIPEQTYSWILCSLDFKWESEIEYKILQIISNDHNYMSVHTHYRNRHIHQGCKPYTGPQRHITDALWIFGVHKNLITNN